MKKIMFNDNFGLTDAVLQGRKTMTRRMCKDSATNEVILSEDVYTWLFYPRENFFEFLMNDGNVKVAVLPYKVGEVVAVAQSYEYLGYSKEWVEQHVTPNPNAKPTDPFEKKYAGLTNKMFVRANLMPRRIRITDINVERLQDISEEDCLHEGVLKREIRPFETIEIKYQVPKTTIYEDTPRDAFSALIDKVSGNGTWERNPLVFCYSFEIFK